MLREREENNDSAYHSLHSAAEDVLLLYSVPISKNPDVKS